jgi:hypothetical protein
VKLSLGDLCGGGTPGPIPNPEVKPVSADGTWRETSRESRSLPRGFSFTIAYAVLSFAYELCMDNTGRDVSLNHSGKADSFDFT